LRNQKFPIDFEPSRAEIWNQVLSLIAALLWQIIELRYLPQVAKLFYSCHKEHADSDCDAECDADVDVDVDVEIDVDAAWRLRKRLKLQVGKCKCKLKSLLIIAAVEIADLLELV